MKEFLNIKDENGHIDPLKVSVISVIAYEKIKDVVSSDEKLEEIYQENVNDPDRDITYTLNEFVNAVHEARGE